MRSEPYNEEESKELINFYYQNPQHNTPQNDHTIDRKEGNAICGDDIIVFLHINQKTNIIENRNFSGNTSMVTTAASSFFGDLALGKDIDTILTRDYNYIQQEGFKVSPRRKRAVVMALLATKNAIHKYKKDNIKESFEDVLNGS